MKSYSRTVSYNDFFGKETTPPLLSHLIIELTERCNNRCIHCCVISPQKGRKQSLKELETDEFLRIIEEAASLGCKNVRLTGGEPLLHKDFTEIYTFTKNKGLKVEIFTNGTLITPQIADLFTKIPPGENISVTLYGISKETYEAVSQVKGSFAAAKKGLHRLLERNIPFTVDLAILPQNISDKDEFSHWLARELPNIKGKALITPLYAHTRRDSGQTDTIYQNRFSAEKIVEISQSICTDYPSEIRERVVNRNRPDYTKVFSCGAGFARGTIDPYGMLQMCTMLRHPETLYDLRKGTLKDAFTIFYPKLRKLLVSDKEYIERCGKCFFKGFCDSCPAASWAEKGLLDSFSLYFCDIAHCEAIAAGLLQPGENAWEIDDWKERIDKVKE